MTEFSKYDVLISDLNVIQAGVTVLLNKLNDLNARNADLENLLSEMNSEKFLQLEKIKNLKEELEELRTENQSSLFGSLSGTEKEELKHRIRDMISRIDNHLSS